MEIVEKPLWQGPFGQLPPLTHSHDSVPLVQVPCAGASYVSDLETRQNQELASQGAADDTDAPAPIHLQAL